MFRYLMNVFATGTMLWVVHGLFKDNWVIIRANVTASASSLILLYMKFAYEKKPYRVA